MRRGETKTLFFDEIVAKLERNESEVKKQPSRNNLSHNAFKLPPPNVEPPNFTFGGPTRGPQTRAPAAFGAQTPTTHAFSQISPSVLGLASRGLNIGGGPTFGSK